jgi:cytochrome c
MKTVRRVTLLSGLSATAFALCLSTDAVAADAAAAQALARQNNCFKCHSIEKKGDMASWKEIAAKVKNEKGIEAKLMTHLTTGPKVKFPDGTETTHPVIKAKDQAEIKNLIEWILSL